MSECPEAVFSGGTTPPNPPAQDQPDEAEAVAADLLVEEVSIDGMCGVY